jgi:wyosine [tRNA(Phe)-imidazoG37] synthetase (radical SAM superfamily)
MSEAPEKTAGPEPISLASRATLALQQAFAAHPRLWRDFHYVYPVLSRRSRGLSIGVNLNIDKACNFDCIYCCVDRTVPPPRKDVDLVQLCDELDQMLGLAVGGEIWRHPPFDRAPQRLRRINDIAFSGDGEPTAYPRFDEACRIAADLKRSHGLRDVKIVVITNATRFDRPAVQRGLKLLDANQGEIWAKLDAGTEVYYRLIDRTGIPLRRVLGQILACGRDRPIVIQSLFMSVRGQPTPDAEFDAYLDRLRELIAVGCQIKLVQLYTVARPTAERYVTPLTAPQLDRLAARLRQRLPGVPAQTYYGVGETTT